MAAPAATDHTCLKDDLTTADQQDSADTRPALPPIQSQTSSGLVTNIHQPVFKTQAQPKSPSPSSQSRHLEFLSWISGRGSPSGQDSSKNSSVNFCRICHEGESGGERLISPCRCSGSVGLIHRSCIEKWLTIVNNDVCELCKQKYSVTLAPSAAGCASLLWGMTRGTWWVTGSASSSSLLLLASLPISVLQELLSTSRYELAI